MRANNRNNNQIRSIIIEKNVIHGALGSCLIKWGNTHVICTAYNDNYIPPFLKGSSQGWLTAEYAMLPCCSSQRIKRDISKGKISARTQEIQRLIGRALRSTLNLHALGERQIIIDCDVINADGGTRVASITGGYIALQIAIEKLLSAKIIKTNPIKHQIAAVSCGILKGTCLLDLDYDEDSNAEVDANFVMNTKGELIEIQASSEQKLFSQKQLMQMLEIADSGIKSLIEIQSRVLAE